MMWSRVWQSIPLLLWVTSSVLSESVFGERSTEASEDDHNNNNNKGLETGLIPDLADVLEAIAASAGSVWNGEVIESAVSLRRAIRSVGRQTRDLSAFLYPVVSSLSVLAQVVSYLPGVMQVLVTGVSGVVEVVGRGIVMLGTGVDFSGSAIDTVGRSVQTLSSSVPSLVTGVVVAGGFLLMLYPGLQEALFSAVASVGLMLAGRLAGGARNFVDKNSFWSTILQTLEIFTQKARQEYT